MISAPISNKGELVIPKKIRDAVGIRSGGEVTLVLRDNAVIVMPKQVDVVAKAADRAARLNVDVSKLTLGDALYKELF